MFLLQFCIMNNFPTPNIDNLAGLEKFNFIEVENIVSIPEPLDQIISSPITIKIGSVWLNGYGSINSLKFSEISKKNDSGIYYKCELNGFTPESIEILQLFSKMDGHKFILRITDNDDLIKILGKADQPLEFNTDFQTQTVNGVKGYNYKFFGNIKKRSPVYDLDSSSSYPSG